MSQRSRRTLSVTIGAVLALCTSMFAIVPASAAEVKAERHCVLVLAPLEKGEKLSKVLGESCGTSKAQAISRSDVSAAAAAVDLFMIAEHANWGGTYYWVTGGAACDNAGYSFTPTSWWQSNISSSSSDNNCDTMNIQNREGNRANGIATHRSSMPGGFNDNVAFVNFYNG
jgi:hypothetical protein